MQTADPYFERTKTNHAYCGQRQKRTVLCSSVCQGKILKPKKYQEELIDIEEKMFSVDSFSCLKWFLYLNLERKWIYSNT